MDKLTASVVEVISTLKRNHPQHIDCDSSVARRRSTQRKCYYHAALKGFVVKTKRTINGFKIWRIE